MSKIVPFFLLVLATACTTYTDNQDQPGFQDKVEGAGIVPPDFGFKPYDDGMFLWSNQSAPDIANPNQVLGTRGADRARNWVWDRTNVSMFPLLEGSMAVAFGGPLAFDDTYLFTFAADYAVPGEDEGWAIDNESTEEQEYVFYRSDECGHPVVDICLHVDKDGKPGPDDCDGMYVAPDPCPNGYVEEEDTGE